MHDKGHYCFQLLIEQIRDNGVLMVICASQFYYAIFNVDTWSECSYCNMAHGVNGLSFYHLRLRPFYDVTQV
jgi:hypothetical protein